MRAQRPTFDQLPVAFNHPVDSSLYPDQAAYAPPPSQNVGSWQQSVQPEYDFYQPDRLLNQGYLPSPFSVASSYPELETPGYGTDRSPVVGEHDVYNVFDVDFGSAVRHPGVYSMHHKAHSGSPPYEQSIIPSSPSSDVSPASSSSSASYPAPSRTVSASDPKRRFPCLVPGCNRRFTSQYTLKVHTEAHRPKPRVSFPCTMGCQEKFSRQHDRLRHEVAKHNKVCEHSCVDCGRFFSNAKTFGNHKCPVAQGGTRWIRA
ncbi:hypothetical protein DL96DRAFT_1605808, partial [Flagelloscypha sp. PMI_526]